MSPRVGSMSWQASREELWPDGSPNGRATNRRFFPAASHAHELLRNHLGATQGTERKMSVAPLSNADSRAEPRTATPLSTLAQRRHGCFGPLSLRFAEQWSNPASTLFGSNASGSRPRARACMHSVQAGGGRKLDWPHTTPRRSGVTQPGLGKPYTKLLNQTSTMSIAPPPRVAEIWPNPAQH